MHRILWSLASLVFAFPLIATAGSPHFVGCSLSQIDNDTLCAEGKMAGLGNEAQVDITLSVTAHCQNPGGNNPKAANKTTFDTTQQFPVQNGRALFDLCVDVDFQPHCSPPMTVVMDAMSLTDATHGIGCTLD